jgi:hypothetical protein
MKKAPVVDFDFNDANDIETFLDIICGRINSVAEEE